MKKKAYQKPYWMIVSPPAIPAPVPGCLVSLDSFAHEMGWAVDGESTRGIVFTTATGATRTLPWDLWGNNPCR
jgi:hypothetical protein